MRLEIDPDQIRYIPANVQAQISATTAFGAKFVELVYPADPSPARLAAGAVLHSKNVSTEINTVFENVVDLLKMIDPVKLNAVLTAVAEGVRGQGERIGEATTDLNQVLLALNERSDTIRQDWRSFKNFNDTYDAAAQDILTILNAASTTSTTVVNHSAALDALLLNTIGFSQGRDQPARHEVGTISSHRSTLSNRRRTCCSNTAPSTPACCRAPRGSSTTGAIRRGAAPTAGTIQLDVALLLGNDPYVYPDNLPIVAAKGGPGGKPGCGSLPDAYEELPGAPARHQHRLGNRARYAAQPRHRASLLG